MTSGAKLNEPGIAEKFWIDGVAYDMPVEYQPSSQLAQTVFTTMSGAQIVRSAYRGDGLPDRLDNFTFVIPYEIDDATATLAELIETLRVTPGPHYFADWKQRVAYYTLPPNKPFLYLPREDASQRAWIVPNVSDASFTPAWTGTPQTTVYKPLVAETDVVPANEIWVSQQTIKHPDAGRWVAPIKLGSPPNAPSSLLAKYFMLFRVEVLDVVSTFGTRAAGREDKVITLTESVN